MNISELNSRIEKSFIFNMIDEAAILYLMQEKFEEYPDVQTIGEKLDLVLSYGYGTPFYNLKCPYCGNVLSGMAFLIGTKENNAWFVDYMKGIIAGYDVNGIYYTDGYYELVDKIIKEKENNSYKIKPLFEELIKKYFYDK